MLASAVFFRWLLLAVALLLCAALAASAPTSAFQVTYDLPFDRSLGFSVNYDLTLTGPEPARGSGIYGITGASGTRTLDYGNGTTERDAVEIVNALDYQGTLADNFLYYTASAQRNNPDGVAYFDGNGTGQWGAQAGVLLLPSLHPLLCALFPAHSLFS